MNESGISDRTVVVSARKSVEITSTQVDTRLHAAASANSVEKIKEILDEKLLDVDTKSQSGMTPLGAAIIKGNVDAAKLLIQYGSNISWKDPKGNGYIHIAVLQNKKECCELLLESGANVDSTNAVGETPLHISCRQGFIEIIKLLVTRKASFSIKDQFGKVPFDQLATKCRRIFFRTNS